MHASRRFIAGRKIASMNIETESTASSPSNRAILAANIWAMIAASSDMQKPSVRGWALQKGLDVRLIDRIVKGQHAVTLDKIEEIAAACGLQAWHLLLPGLDPSNPPAAKVTDEDLSLLSRLRHLLGQGVPPQN